MLEADMLIASRFICISRISPEPNREYLLSRMLYPFSLIHTEGFCALSCACISMSSTAVMFGDRSDLHRLFAAPIASIEPEAIAGIPLMKFRARRAIPISYAKPGSICVCGPLAGTEPLQAVSTPSSVQVTPARPEMLSAPVPLKLTPETYQPPDPSEPLRLPLADGATPSNCQELESLSVRPEEAVAV
jgi:hypothetical protein